MFSRSYFVRGRSRFACFAGSFTCPVLNDLHRWRPLRIAAVDDFGEVRRALPVLIDQMMYGGSAGRGGLAGTYQRVHGIGNAAATGERSQRKRGDRCRKSNVAGSLAVLGGGPGYLTR